MVSPMPRALLSDCKVHLNDSAYTANIVSLQKAEIHKTVVKISELINRRNDTLCCLGRRRECAIRCMIALVVLEYLTSTVSEHL